MPTEPDFDFGVLSLENAVSGQIDTPEQPRFVEALVQNNTITELVGSNANLLIHLGLARIEVPAGFDSASIRVVLETLQGGPC